MLVVALVALLLVPVVVALHVAGDSAAGFALEARVRILGVLRLTRRPRSRAAPPAPRAATPRAAPAAGAAAPAAAASPRPPRLAAWQRRIRRLLERAALVRRALASGAVRIEQPAGWIEYALADVAETGELYGFLSATRALVDPAGAVAIQPLWNEEDWLALDLSVAARIHPLRLGLVLASERLAARRRRRTTAGEEIGDRAA